MATIVLYIEAAMTTKQGKEDAEKGGEDNNAGLGGNEESTLLKWEERVWAEDTGYGKRRKV